MSSQAPKQNKVNVRRAEVMERVEQEIQQHYMSEFVAQIRANGNRITLGSTHFVLAAEFGFCNGVRRAIDIAYAACKVFAESRIFLIGEIIHNPAVNRHLNKLGVRKLPWRELGQEYAELQSGDVVIVPAFGVPTEYMDFLESKGVSIVDTTCGDVMKVWRRVKSYAKQSVTSIIHGKATHEETRATASRAMGDDGQGRYVIVFAESDMQTVCQFVLGEIDSATFMESMRHAVSPGFLPARDLIRVGLANQTTMLEGETQLLQRMLHDAIVQRDGNATNFHVFDTICPATQNRQDALFALLKKPLDAMVVVGGYNSSNTTHLFEIAQRSLPTCFIDSAKCFESLSQVRCYCTQAKGETQQSLISAFADTARPLTLGITAGASCPANLIEETVRRIAELRG